MGSRPCPAPGGACPPGPSGPSLHPQLLRVRPGPPSHRGPVRTSAAWPPPRPKALDVVASETAPLPYNTTCFRVLGNQGMGVFGGLLLCDHMRTASAGWGTGLQIQGLARSEGGGGGPHGPSAASNPPRKQLSYLEAFNQPPLAPQGPSWWRKHRLGSEPGWSPGL